MRVPYPFILVSKVDHCHIMNLSRLSILLPQVLVYTQVSEMKSLEGAIF